MSDSEILLMTGVKLTYCIGFIKGLYANESDPKKQEQIDKFFQDLQNMDNKK